MTSTRCGLALVCLLALSQVLAAHSGPPYELIATRVEGPYKLSVWTDPDTTDDGSAGGQFWVTLQKADGSTVPADTRARVSVSPAEGNGPIESGTTRPEKGNLSRQFVALSMDHEGRFNVAVEVNGSLGEAKVSGQVDATYDLRPPRQLMYLYIAPFVLFGFLWVKLLLRRRRKAV